MSCTTPVCRRLLRAVACVAVALLGSSPLVADWLVLETGKEVETRGPWKVDGRRVLYTSATGVYSSVRTSAVDLAASLALTEEKATAAQEPEEAAEAAKKPEPVLVLRDGDLAEVELDTGEEEPAPAPEYAVVPTSDNLENREARQVPASSAVQVLNWSARPTGEDQVSILGQVSNRSEHALANINLTVALLDERGRTLEQTNADLSTGALMPGERAFFEAVFSDLLTFTTVELAPTSIELQVRSEESEE